MRGGGPHIARHQFVPRHNAHEVRPGLRAPATSMRVLSLIKARSNSAGPPLYLAKVRAFAGGTMMQVP